MPYLPRDAVEFVRWTVRTPAEDGPPDGLQVFLAGQWRTLEANPDYTPRPGLTIEKDGIQVPAVESSWRILVAGATATAPGAAVILPTRTKVRARLRFTEAPETVPLEGGMIYVL